MRNYHKLVRHKKKSSHMETNNARGYNLLKP